MSTTLSNDTYRHPPITIHADERSDERFSELDLNLALVWERGVAVELPDKDYDAARYYPPSDLVLLLRGGVVTTALYASESRVNAPGLVQCDSCNEPHDPVTIEETCPWCEATIDGGWSSGPITLRREGGS